MNNLLIWLLWDSRSCVRANHGNIKWHAISNGRNIRPVVNSVNLSILHSRSNLEKYKVDIWCSMGKIFVRDFVTQSKSIFQGLLWRIYTVSLWTNFSPEMTRFPCLIYLARHNTSARLDEGSLRTSFPPLDFVRLEALLAACLAIWYSYYLPPFCRASQDRCFSSTALSNVLFSPSMFLGEPMHGFSWLQHTCFLFFRDIISPPADSIAWGSWYTDPLCPETP